MMNRSRSYKPAPADARLIEAAAAARRYADWIKAAGEPCNESGLRYPAEEFRERFTSFEVNCAAGDFIPANAFRLLQKLLKSLRDECKGEGRSEIGIGTAFAAEIDRFARLMVFYATEPAPPAKKRPVSRPRIAAEPGGKPAAVASARRRSQR